MAYEESDSFCENSSRDSSVKSPAEHYFQLKKGDFVAFLDKKTGEQTDNGGDKLQLQYWDSEKEERVNANMASFRFIVLSDAAFHISGYKEQDDGQHESYNSSLCFQRGEPGDNYITIWQKKGKNTRQFLSGAYADVKEEIKANGLSYVTRLFVIAYHDGAPEGELAVIDFTRSSLKAWMEFRNENKNLKNTKYVFGFGEALDKKKGTNEYFEPTFVYEPITPEQIEKAKELAPKVDNYLNDRRLHNRKIALDDPDFRGEPGQPSQAFTATQPRMATTKTDKPAPEPEFDVPEVQYESDIDPASLPF